MWCPNVWCLVVPKSVVPGLVGLAWICGAQICGAVVPKCVVPWCQICGAVVPKMWCQLVPLVPRFPSNLARFRGFPEMLTTSCFPGSHWVPKTPQNSPKTPFLTRNGTKKQTGSPLPKPEAALPTRKPLYTTISSFVESENLYQR